MADRFRRRSVWIGAHCVQLHETLALASTDVGHGLFFLSGVDNLVGVAEALKIPWVA